MRGAAAAGPWRPLTVRVGPEVDPSAVVFASRRPGDAWACLEQPDRDGAAIAALGCIARLEGGGAKRFATAAAAWRRLAADAIGDVPDGPPGAGLIALGGFSFAPEGAAGPALERLRRRRPDRPRARRSPAAAATSASR